jgi:TM2 domain-containing membrane protein YozV
MDNAEMMMFQHAQRVPENRRAEFQMIYQTQKKDRTTALLFSLFLGTWGADRFYLGQTGLGAAKLLTFGGLLWWTFIDWFLIMGAADAYNMGVVTKLMMMYPAALPPGYAAPQMGWQGGPT